MALQNRLLAWVDDRLPVISFVAAHTSLLSECEEQSHNFGDVPGSSSPAHQLR
jgi:hypothetical protein